MVSGSDIEKDHVLDGSVSVNVDGGRTIEQLKSTLITKLSKAGSPLPSTCCIFRVPDVLRRQKKRAYEPNIVSIGPLHRGADHAKFKLVENVKEWYLKRLLDRMKGAMTLDSLINSIKEREKEARGCYSDPCKHLDQNDFIEMLILDGCFLTELFRRAADADERHDDNDPIFNVSCMLQYLCHDLLCLENQLPWSVLEFFYNKIEHGNPDPQPLSILVINFFRNLVADHSNFSDPEPGSREPLHILDLIRTSLVQGYNGPKDPTPKLPYHLPEEIPSTATFRRPIGAGMPRAATPRAGTPLVGAGMPRAATPRIGAGTPRIGAGMPRAATLLDGAGSSTRCYTTLPQRLPSAATLSEAGVKFRKAEGTRRGILDITFEKGKFTIPQLAIYDETETLFRNLMAYEQCYRGCKHMITSYAVVMDSLIDTAKDMDLLREKGIVANWVSADDAPKFFNDLCNDTTVVDFAYNGLSTKVNEYYNATWNRWKEKARRDYFATPWSTISFVAAFVLLVLTFLQTIYTLQQYYHPPN